MTLKLVHDADVEQIPVGNLQDIGGMARRFADQLDAGEWGEASRAIVVLETPSGLAILGWGENTTAYELMGLFEAAKLRVFADDFIPDE